MKTATTMLERPVARRSEGRFYIGMAFAAVSTIADWATPGSYSSPPFWSSPATRPRSQWHAGVTT
jgi:hypothetical protein